MAYEKFGKNLNVVFKVSSAESSSSPASVICNCANSNNWIRELSFQLNSICRLSCCNEINLILLLYMEIILTIKSKLTIGHTSCTTSLLYETLRNCVY